MKKLMAFTAVAVAMSMSPALAEPPEGGAGPHGGGMFEKHDTNGDGVISKDEFLAQAEERFKQMDTNGDGKITKEEGQAAHEGMREKMKERRHERMEKRGDMPDAPPPPPQEDGE